MASFRTNDSLLKFQHFIGEVYGLPDDRLYSIWDLLTQQQRFAMRALKGIRKSNKEKTKINLLISFAWLMAIANRLHIQVEDDVWKRFPYLCSYCGGKPCVCKKIKPDIRKKVKINNRLKPKTVAQFQQMFAAIYPPQSRTLADAGVHLAEECGEVSEAIHSFLGQHLQKQFDDIKLEIADFVSCMFGVANSLKLDIATELTDLFFQGCHVCHATPCACTFTTVATIKT